MPVTHSYAKRGTYTVTLTINDGVDTNTITRTRYIAVGYRTYLPLVMASELRNIPPSDSKFARTKPSPISACEWL